MSSIQVPNGKFIIEKGKVNTSELSLIFFAFLFANFTVFVKSIMWLYPIMVLINATLWFILAIICIWKLWSANILAGFLLNLRRNWIIIPFVIFSGVTLLWSISRDISIYRWLVLVFTFIVGGYIGYRYSFKEFIISLSNFGLFIILLSFLFVLLLPDIGIMNYHIIQGAWKGLYWHKNHMGLIASFINIVFLVSLINSFRSENKQKYSWTLMYLFSLLFIYKTDSIAAYITTILINGFILISLIWLKFRNKIQKYHYLFFILLLVIVSSVLFMNIDHIFGIFNRNTTLTGRIPMWSYLYDTYITKQPLLGYGFNAFWYVESHRLAIQQAAGYPDPIVIADNGFIDLLVNTGFIGLFLFLIFYFGIWWRSIKYAWKASDITGLLPIILMTFTLMANISWSLLFENESFFMLIMIAVLFSISKKEFFEEKQA